MSDDLEFPENLCSLSGCEEERQEKYLLCHTHLHEVLLMTDGLGQLSKLKQDVAAFVEYINSNAKNEGNKVISPAAALVAQIYYYMQENCKEFQALKKHVEQKR